MRFSALQLGDVHCVCIFHTGCHVCNLAGIYRSNRIRFVFIIYHLTLRVQIITLIICYSLCIRASYRHSSCC